MLGFFRAMKFGAAILAGALIMVAASTESRAQTGTTGTVRIQIVKAGSVAARAP